LKKRLFLTYTFIKHSYFQLLGLSQRPFAAIVLVLLVSVSCSFSQSPESPIDNELKIETPPPAAADNKAGPNPFRGENIEFYSLSPKFQYVVYSGPYAYSVDQQDTVWTYIDENGYKIHGFQVDLHKRFMHEGKLRFVLREAGNPNGKRLNGIQYEDSIALKAQVADQQATIELPFEPETFVVVPLGVGEDFKKQLETKIGKSVPSDMVACFQLDKLGNVLNLSPEDLNRIIVTNTN
jgi:hypothetical protein